MGRTPDGILTGLLGASGLRMDPKETSGARLTLASRILCVRITTFLASGCSLACGSLMSDCGIGFEISSVLSLSLGNDLFPTNKICINRYSIIIYLQMQIKQYSIKDKSVRLGEH